MSDRPAVFVSGGSRGIGLAILRRFHAAGYRCGTCARSEAGLAEAAAELDGLHTWVADLGDRAATEAVAAGVQADLGPLDVLVHNAGVFALDDTSHADLEVFDRLMEVNLASAVVLSRRLVPAMRARRRGTVVHINSVAGVTGYPSGQSYGISKHAMLGLARAMRAELREHGVRVISVLPGATWTDTWSGVDVQEPRLMPAEDVAEAVWMACTASPRTVVEEILLRPQLGDL